MKSRLILINLTNMATNKTIETHSTKSVINCGGKNFSKEELFSINPDDSELRSIANTRKIDNLFHSVTKRLDKDFTSVKIEVETNINEYQMENFEKEWKSGWNTKYTLGERIIVNAPERSVIEVSMDDFELWLKLYP